MRHVWTAPHWQGCFKSVVTAVGAAMSSTCWCGAWAAGHDAFREGWVKPEADYYRFKTQLERVPADQLPADKRFNPLAFNPYVLYKALPQVRRYSEAELVRAMELLLRCNQRLVSSSLDETLVLQQTLVQIVGNAEPRANRTARV